MKNINTDMHPLISDIVNCAESLNFFHASHVFQEAIQPMDKLVGLQDLVSDMMSLPAEIHAMVVADAVGVYYV